MTPELTDQICPSCSRQLPPDQLICECGFALADADPANASSENAADAPEQEVFVSYLIARVEQAREALDAVRGELEGKPGDIGKAMEVMEAVQDLRIARAELDQRLGRESPFADAIQEKPSEEFRAEQSARAQRILEEGASRAEAGPPPYRRAPTAPSAEQARGQKRRSR